MRPSVRRAADAGCCMIRRHYLRPTPATPDKMNCQTSSHDIPVARAAGLLLVAVPSSPAACYRPYIQQGNFLEIKDVDQVTSGMTRSQVRYLLGTPMISDPFEAQRWDYIYTLKRGRHRKIDRAHFVVYFDDDKVTRVDKLDLPEPNRGIETGLPEVERTKRKWRSRPSPPTTTRPSGSLSPRRRGPTRANPAGACATRALRVSGGPRADRR